MKTKLLLSLTWVLMSWVAMGNNIQISNVRLVDQDVSAGTNNPANHTFIRLNLNWENSWRLGFSTGVNNKDAAWIFAKYRINGGPWLHVHLANSGHDGGTWAGGTGGPVAFESGLLNPEAAHDPASNPCLGVFVYSETNYTNDFEATNMRLRWNYGEQGIPDNALIEIKVFALEMVYVPTGSFFVGTQGTEQGSFTNGSWTSGPTVPLRINSEGALTIGTAAGQLWGRSSTGDSAIGGAGTLAASFPKGFRGFYGMKYEISQQQWVDFFNTLSVDQKAARDITAANGKNSDALVNRNNISWDSGDAVLLNEEFGDVACNFLNWADVAAYLDWAALRPMSELEFEKASRGDRAGDDNEYAWGTSNIVDSVYSLSNAGLENEGIATGYVIDGLTGNAHYTSTNGPAGPLRVGIFAANPATTGRSTAGASRSGLLEMSGNVWEPAVSVGNTTGRAYTGVHGNGLISSSGEADASNWPLSSGEGSGWRGGGWNSTAAALRIADRRHANTATTTRNNEYGGRGVRTRICDVPSGQANAVTDSTLVNFENVRALQTGGAGVGEGYLWVVPSDWRIISGQGTTQVFVVVGTLPAEVQVYLVNECGAGPDRITTINP